MALPEADLARVQAWCVPVAARAQLRIVGQGDALSLTVLEERPVLGRCGGVGTDAGGAAAQPARRGEWSLYCVTGNGELRLDDLPPTPSVISLLEEIERDPTANLLGL